MDFIRANMIDAELAAEQTSLDIASKTVELLVQQSKSKPQYLSSKQVDALVKKRYATEQRRKQIAQRRRNQLL